MQRLESISSTLQDSVLPYVIIGAGAGGLQAAEILSEGGKQFIILEAQDHIGGRINTIHFNDVKEIAEAPWTKGNKNVFNTCVQKGATWIETGHDVILKICKQNGIAIKEQFSEGNNIYVTKNRVYTHKELMGDKQIGQKLFKAVTDLGKLSEDYGVEVLSGKEKSKKYTQLLRKYDKMTVSEYLQQTIPQPFIRQFLENIIEHTECADCSKNSMHEMLMKNACSDDIEIVKTFLGQFSNQHSYMVEGGTEMLIKAFVKNIEKNIKKSISSVLKLQCPVYAIDNSQKVIQVKAKHQGKDIVIKAQKVIVNVPIGVMKNIKITKLSKEKQIVFNNQLQTTSQKTFIIARTPFWRKNGFTGDCLFSKEIPINMCHDISPSDVSCGILVFFHNATKLEQWKRNKQLKEKKAYFKTLLGNMFMKGDTSHPDLQDFVLIQNTFSDNKYIQGCFQSNTMPGVYNRLLDMGFALQAFYRDEQGIIFVGSQYSKEYASYIEGALRVARLKMFTQLNKKDPLSTTNN